MTIPMTHPQHPLPPLPAGHSPPGHALPPPVKSPELPAHSRVLPGVTHPCLVPGSPAVPSICCPFPSWATLDSVSFWTSVAQCTGSCSCPGGRPGPRGEAESSLPTGRTGPEPTRAREGAGTRTPLPTPWGHLPAPGPCPRAKRVPVCPREPLPHWPRLCPSATSPCIML